MAAIINLFSDPVFNFKLKYAERRFQNFMNESNGNKKLSYVYCTKTFMRVVLIIKI